VKAIVAKDESLRIPSPIPAQTFIFGGLLAIVLTLCCLSMDAFMFARGFPENPSPLDWPGWFLVVYQSLLGLLVVPTSMVIAYGELAVFLTIRRLKRRNPKWWQHARKRGFFEPVSPWHHFANVSMLCCGIALLWPAVQIFFLS